MMYVLTSLMLMGPRASAQAPSFRREIMEDFESHMSLGEVRYVCTGGARTGEAFSPPGFELTSEPRVLGTLDGREFSLQRENRNVVMRMTKDKKTIRVVAADGGPISFNEEGDGPALSVNCSPI